MLKEIAFKLVNPVIVFDRPRTLEQTVVYSVFFRGIFLDVLSTDNYDKDNRHYNQVDRNNQKQSYDIILSATLGNTAQVADFASIHSSEGSSDSLKAGFNPSTLEFKLLSICEYSCEVSVLKISIMKL